VKTDHEPAVLVGRYSLQALIDRTPLGTVWLARDIVLDRGVTVTLVDERIGADDTSRERLFANARALAAASPSTLVRLLDAGTDGETPFLVTERIDGETLAETLERDRRLPAAEAARIVAQTLDGLAEAHAAGVLHLDVTPSNVLVQRDGRVRVRGAGIAQPALAAPLGAPAGAASSFGPPELPAADARSDVWAAGALLFTLLTGRAPDAANAARLGRVRAPRAIRAILARSLASDPADRFPDAFSMAAALRSAAPPPRPRVAAAARLAAFRTWVAVPLLVGIVALLVLAGGIWAGRIEIGGPVGIRLPAAEGAAPPASAALAVEDVRVVDPPPGDGHENDEDLAYVTDGDPATLWRSENYYDGRLNKPGMGLLLDLGHTATVTGLRLDTPAGGFTFSVVVGDDVSSMVGQTATAERFTAPDVERDLPPRTGRYVMVWITSVVPVPDGSRAEVSEVRVLGTA
jgi:serine/threonine-protein kinase